MKNNSLVFWGVCFILVLPIILLPPIFQPNDWSRSCLFRITLTGLAIFIFYKFFYKKQTSITLPKLKNPVVLPMAILILLTFFIFLSVIFSEDIMFSIFGSPARTGGFLNFLFFVIFAVFLPLFVNEIDWKKLFNALFIAGILASFLAIIQYFNLLRNIFLSYEGGATPSFLGNSTFLAIYMLFLAFLAFSLFLVEKNIKKKLFYLGLFFLFSFTILISGSRATYLGMLIGFLYFLFFYPKKFKTLKIIGAALILLAIIIAVFFNLFPQIGEKNSLLKTLSNRASFQKIATDVAGTRFAAWQITWQTIKEKPIFGWGPENSYIGFEKYYDPTLPNLQRLWWDRPHNVFLEIWANSGIFAFLAYLIFWAVLFFYLQKLKQKNDDALMAHSLQAMFIGYLVVLFFNFDNFSTYLISFFLIGYSFFLIFNQNKEEKFTVLATPKNIIQKKPVFIFLMAFLTIFLWTFNIKPLYLNEQISHAGSLTSIKKCDRSLAIMNNVWKSGGILKSYSGLKYADSLKICVPAQPDKEVEYTTRGLEALKQVSLLQPKYARTWIFMGSFTNVLAAKEENLDSRNKLLAEAMNYLKKAKEISPSRPEIFIEIEKNHIIAKNYEKMKETAQDCIKIDSSRGECYWYLGIAEIFLGDQQNGKKHIQESKEKNYNNPPYIQLGAAYISQKNYKDAYDVYNLLVNIYPNNASYHAVAAYLAKEIGNYDKAVEQTLEVFKLQPDNKDVLSFMQILLRQNANNYKFHQSMAYIYRQLGRNEDAKNEILIARDILSEKIRSSPNSSDLYYLLAGVHKEMEEYDKSIEYIITSLKLNPSTRDRVENFLKTFPSKYSEKISNLLSR